MGFIKKGQALGFKVKKGRKGKRKKKPCKTKPSESSGNLLCGLDKSQLNLVVEKTGREQIGGCHSWALGSCVFSFLGAGEESSRLC